MTVLKIRMHRRYAARGLIRIQRADGTGVRGLMIELSAHGVRISNLRADGEACELAEGERVTVTLEDEHELEGLVRWSHDHIAAVRLDEPLHPSRMARILDIARPDDELRRYAT